MTQKNSQLNVAGAFIDLEMNNMITANYNKLLEDATETARNYMYKAVKYIDQEFGDGYAKQHPDLVADFMKVSGHDLTAATLAVAIQEASDKIAGALHEVAEMIGRTAE